MQVVTHKTNGAQAHVNLDVYPDTCPICHRGIEAIFVAARSGHGGTLDAIFWCPRGECRRTFIGRYADAPNGVYKFFFSTPTSPVKPQFPDAICGVSPVFVEIMGQVTHAEANGLDQLVGIGLRKALEFLIKDYACKLKPDKSESIKSSTLAQCISNFVTDPNIKSCAERAAWLGNDETHYLKKWETKDVGDLKTLVHLAVNWIDSSLLTEQYLATMPKQ
jgi:hypothetical protein